MMRKKKSPAFVMRTLYSDEQILWMDRPVLMRPRHVSPVQIIFGLFWTGMVIFMQTQIADFGSRPRLFGRSSSFDGFQSIFSLVLLGFTFIGLGMIFSPVLHALRMWRTWYIVTNRRALIITDYFVYQHTLSYEAHDLGEIRRSVHGDGTGDVFFASQQYTYTRHNDSGGMHVSWSKNQGTRVHFGKRRYTGTKRIGFRDVESDEDAARLLNHLKNGTIDDMTAIDEDKLKRRQSTPRAGSSYANSGHFLDRDRDVAD